MSSGYAPPAGFEGITVSSQPFGAMPSLPFPGLSKKMKDIHALRYINSIKLTRKEIESVLPPLKSLRNAEKTAQTQSERALDEERTSLLEANPDDPDAVNSMPSVQIELDRFHQAEQKTWREIEKVVGGQKATMLQVLIGRIGTPGMYSPAGGIGSGFGGFAPTTNPFGGKKGGVAPTPPLPGNPSKLGSPARPEPEVLPVPPLPIPKSDTPDEVAAIEPQDPLLAAPSTSVEVQEPQLATPRPNIPAAIAGQVPATPSAPVLPPRATTTRGAIAFPVPGQINGFGGYPARVNLSELIELLEQKLAAMKR